MQRQPRYDLWLRKWKGSTEEAMKYRQNFRIRSGPRGASLPPDRPQCNDELALSLPKASRVKTAGCVSTEEFQSFLMYPQHNVASPDSCGLIRTHHGTRRSVTLRLIAKMSLWREAH